MRRRTRIVIVAALGVVYLFASALGAAQSVKTPVEFFEVSCLVDPGTQWVGGKDGKMLHVRGQVAENTLYDPATGLAIGMNHAIANLDFNTVTGSGQASGTFSSYFLADPAGTFDGTFNGKIIGFIEFRGKAVGQGRGSLKGQKIKSTLQSIDPATLPLEILLALPCDVAQIVGVYYDAGFIHDRAN